MSFKAKEARDRIRNFSRRFNRSEPSSSEKATPEGITRKQIGQLPTSLARSNVPSSKTNGQSHAPATTPTKVNGAYRAGAASTTTGSTGSTSNGGPTSTGAASTIRSSNTQSTAGTASSTLGSSISPSSPFNLRPPTLHRKFSILQSITKDFVLPDLPWLCGTWHITHSTLPMWRGKRNVRITYTRMAGDKLDDLVTYQNAVDEAIHEVHGVDTPKRDGRYSWRGKGMLKVASSKWEVLGWGGGGPSGAEEWVVTYFNRTMFTPAGIDIYSRSQHGLSKKTVDKLRKGLEKIHGPAEMPDADRSKAEGDFGQLVASLFEVKRDGARTDDKSGLMVVQDDAQGGPWASEITDNVKQNINLLRS